MTPNEKIENIKKDISTLYKSIEELEESNEKNRDELTEISRTIKTTERNLEKYKIDHKKFQMNIQKDLYKISNTNSLIEEKKNILQDVERNIAIYDLIAKQQTFWDALEQRMNLKGEDINIGLHGMGDSKDPATVIETLKRMTEGKLNFDLVSTKIRTTCSEYEAHIKNMCALVVDGHTITPAHKTERFNILDRFLQDRAIQAYWM